MIAPGFVVVVDDGGAEAPRRVDPRPGDRNRRQVRHEHREPYRQWRQNLQPNFFVIYIFFEIIKILNVMSVYLYWDEGVVGVAVGVGGGEDGEDEEEGSDHLGAERRPAGVAGRHLVGSAAEGTIMVLHNPLCDPNSDGGAQALRHHVQHRPRCRDLAHHRHPQRHRRINVPTLN